MIPYSWCIYLFSPVLFLGSGALHSMPGCFLLKWANLPRNIFKGWVWQLEPCSCLLLQHLTNLVKSAMMGLHSEVIFSYTLKIVISTTRCLISRNSILSRYVNWALHIPPDQFWLDCQICLFTAVMFLKLVLRLVRRNCLF